MLFCQLGSFLTLEQPQRPRAAVPDPISQLQQRGKAKASAHANPSHAVPKTQGFIFNQCVQLLFELKISFLCLFTFSSLEVDGLSHPSFAASFHVLWLTKDLMIDLMNTLVCEPFIKDGLESKPWQLLDSEGH
uniref:Uncharacterized protein n=1 Tax=Geospiza parvula TaxID=87175 RepID=A0A8C3MTD0_GEOPR